VADDGVDFFVDAANGNDDQPMMPTSGSLSKPFKTVAAAILATRAVRSTAPGISASVFLRGNAVHYLAETIHLGPDDSMLTLSAYNNETAVVSGGVLIPNVAWTKAPNSIYHADLSRVDLPAGVPALQFGDPTTQDSTRGILARFPNSNPEIDLFPKGYITDKLQWRPPLYRGEECNERMQCGQSVNVTYVTPETEWHGAFCWCRSFSPAHPIDLPTMRRALSLCASLATSDDRVPIYM
jgi:hypothetical protein